MTYIGKINDIAKPEVKANGVRLVSATISNQIGEIPTCSLLMKPEDVVKFNSPEMEVSVEIGGDSGGGVIFKGYVSGINMTHMSGSLSAGVDLIHNARDLDETSSLVPGVVPGSNAEVETIIFKKQSGQRGGQSSPYENFDINENTFGKAMAEGLATILDKTVIVDTLQYFPSQAGDKEKAAAMLRKIEDQCGKLSVPPGLNDKINGHCTNVVSQAGPTSTIWDVMSVLLGAFDATLLCLPWGGVVAVPNFNGIRSQGNSIPSEIIQKFDRSALMKRSPRECLVMGLAGTDGQRSALSKGAVGRYSSDIPGLRGTILTSCPPWANGLSGNELRDFGLDSLNKLAESNVLRFAHKEKTFNVITPPCPWVFPGVSAKFTPASKLKSFGGQSVDVFEEEFDGYCWKVDHYLSVDNFCTVFWFSCALETSAYQKPEKHPFFQDAKMLPWT